MAVSSWSSDPTRSSSSDSVGSINEHPTTLAVDLGLRTGFAVYGPDDGGRTVLRRYWSAHVGSRSVLKRAAASVVRDVPGLATIVVEGDRAMAELWAQAGQRVGATCRRVAPEEWRTDLFWPRERTPSATAKKVARDKAKQVVDWSRRNGDGPPAVKGTLRTDAADAILIGLSAEIRSGRIRPADLPFPVPGH